MAINIVSLPVGIYMQSGNGVPTHISPKGTEYTDLDTAIVYINKDGIASWAEFLDSTFVITGGTSSYFTGGTVTGPTNFLNGVTANTISATTYYGLPTDVRVTGGTYSSGTILFTNNTGGTFTVTGLTTGGSGSTTVVQFTGGTISGATIFTGGVSANTISATTYYNLPTDVRVTGGTHTNGTTTFTNNTGGTFSVTGYSTGYTLTSSGITTALGYTPLSAYTDTKVTGGTYSNGTAVFTNNTGGTFSVTGLTTPFTGGTVTGPTIFTGGLSANTISATTYYNLPNDLPVSGTAGQILAKNSNTDYDVIWIDNYTSELKHIVKAGEAISIGQAVYVSSANGTNMIVSKASNTSEATSSKTLGLLAQDLALNGQGFVITEGLLAGLNTGSANAGDAVWLGTNGNLIFGLLNKPVAPAHLVYIGVVTRAQTNNGEIFVKTQNGFELNEIHDVLITGVTNGDLISYNSSSSLWRNSKTLDGSYNVTGTLSATTLSATTYQNLPTDIRVTGSTYSNNNFTFTNNTGGTFNVLFNTLTGLTVNGSLTANTISATTYLNLPTDIRVTGGTYTSGTAVFTNNTGGTFSVTGLTTPFTGGTVAGITATTISATTYQNLPTDIRVTGGTYSNGSVLFTNNTGGTFSVTGLTTPFTGGTVTGGTNFTSGLTANTISATTYFNLPTDIRQTGATYSNNNFTFTNNTGGTFNVLFNTVTGLTINGNTSITGTTFLGNGTFTKAGNSSGDILLDNNSTDTPGVLFYYANNSNFGIDSWNGTYDVLSGQLFRFTNKLNESGGSVKMAIDTTGNMVVGGFIKPNAWRAGQVIQDIILSNTEVTVSTTTIATSTSDTDFVGYSYTPLSSNSYLVIHYHLANYDATSGTGNDSWISRIKVDGGEITYSVQSTVNGFRTGVLFPLTGRYTNTNTTAKSIVVACRIASGDDSINITNSATSMWLRITEVAR